MLNFYLLGKKRSTLAFVEYIDSEEIINTMIKKNNDEMEIVGLTNWFSEEFPSMLPAICSKM